MITPRDYQLAAHEATWAYLHQNPDKNPLVVEPTGTGKSLQMAMLIQHLLFAYPHLRIMCVTHVKELVQANHDELLTLWPTAPAGIYSAGLRSYDHRSQVVFAGIMSVGKRAPLFGYVDFLLVDEAHAIGDSDSATYRKFIEQLRGRNPDLIVVGYTATAYRMKGGMLTNGPMFDDVCFDLSSGEAFVWLLEQCYLSRPVPMHPGFQLDSDDIGITAGDFDNRQTSAALREQDILERAVDLMISVGREQGRAAWLHFCQSIDDAELVADMFTYKGEPHEAVHSKRGDRDAVLEAFQKGELRGVTNKDILTTGYNQRNIDMIGVLRLTRSPGLWVQMVGRGTRPVYAPGYNLATAEGRRAAMLAGPKQTCLVMDFVGNTERLGPINYPRLPRRRGKGAGGDMVRLCPECSTYNHISRKTCEQCGHEFPPPERLREEASSEDLVRAPIDLNNLPPPEPPKYEIVGVHRMVASRHQGRNGKPDTMRVDYFCGYHRYSTWVCVQHPQGSYPRRMAEQWWERHGGQMVPGTVEEAVERAGSLNKPKFLKVLVSSKYPQIEAYDFVGTRFELPPELGGPPLADPGPDPLQPKSAAVSDEELASMFQDDEIPF